MKAAALLAFALAGSVLAQTSSAFAPRAVLKVDPEYTQSAQTAQIEGPVVLYAEVGTDGRAQSVRLIRGLGYGLDQKAVQALRKWRFEPALREGVRVAVPATIEVRFRLPRARPPVRV